MLTAILTAFLVTIIFGPDTRADTWKNFSQDNGLSGNEIQFIKADSAGTVWIGTRSGLTAHSGGKFSVRLKSGEVWDIHKAGDNQYWIGAGHGVIKLEGDKQEVFLKGTTVAPLVAFNGSVLAISKNRGTERNSLVQLKDRKWDAVEAFKNEKVINIKRTSDGSAWIVVDGNGVIQVGPGKDLTTATRHLEGSNVTAIFEDSKKRVWLGMWQGGIVMKDGETFTWYLKKEKSFIFEIVEDGKGNIWVATNQKGLWRLDGQKWTNDLREESGINLMAATSDGKVWNSTQAQGGLRYWSGKKWVTSLDSPLPIRCLFESKDKKIWAGGVLDGVHVKN